MLADCRKEYFCIFALSKTSIYMRRLLTTLLMACMATVGNAQQQHNFNSRVIPTPQQVVLKQHTSQALNAYHETELVWALSATPAEVAEAKKQHRTIVYEEQVDSIAGATHQHEAYYLDIAPNTITLRYASPAGRRYGRATLQQLLTVWDGKVPYMTITDWPAYEWRGCLDDISRGPIPNETFRRKQDQYLSQIGKMNYINYYTEHALHNPRYPDIAPVDFRGSLSDLSFCTTMLNLQCFAHFEKTLRIPFYQHMMDTRHNVDPSTEATYSFLREQIFNTYSNFPVEAPFFNINCDETEGLGSGRARHYVDSLGAIEAYCRHINRVYDLIQDCAKELHRRAPEVLMWGDIVGKEPEMLKQLPKEMNYIVWSYVAQESYASMIAPFKKIKEEQGNPFWVAPGVSHWSSAPQVRNYIENIAYLARDGYLAGARGLMNTAWDDSGESLFGDCWHAMTWAAEMAWNPLRHTDPTMAKVELATRERLFNENYDRLMAKSQSHSNPQPTPHTSQMIYLVGNLAHNQWVGDWYSTAALMQPLLDFYPSNVSDDMLTRCDSVDHIVGQVLAQIDSASVPHFYYACHRMLLCSEKCRLRVMMHRRNPKAVALAQRYFANLHQLKLEYLRLWDEECTTYSRDIICERYDRLGRELLDAEGKVFIATQASEGSRGLSAPYVSLHTLYGNRPIYYTTDGNKPSKGAHLYAAPFAIDHSCEVKAVTYNQWDEPVYSQRYLLCHKGMGHLKRLNSAYSTYRDTYSAGGDKALTDGTIGSDDSYNDGHWQGYWGNDIDVELDFGSRTAVNSVSMRFMQNCYDWILAPQTIEVYTSKDGHRWQLLRSEQFNPDFRQSGNIIHHNTLRNLSATTRYLRIVVKNPGVLPPWHQAHGQPSYLFCDEVVVQ